MKRRPFKQQQKHPKNMGKRRSIRSKDIVKQKKFLYNNYKFFFFFSFESKKYLKKYLSEKNI